MKKMTSSILFCLGLILLTACVTQKEPDREDPGGVVITDQQFTSDQMQLGQVDTILFEKIVKCNGEVVPLPEGMAVISAPVGGIIQRISCSSGQPVIKGQTLLEIGGNEVIDIQTQFAEAAAQYRRLQIEHQRLQSLYEEQVTSEKEFIMADSEFKRSHAQYSGLKMKIEAMGLPADKIEGGTLYESYRIVTPVAGNISAMGVHLGSYVEPQREMLEIVDPTKLQLRLSLFASNFATLKRGQTVRYRIAHSDEVYGAVIHAIGVAVDTETKAVSCYASLTDPIPVNPVASEFVQAEVVAASESVAALPDEALLQTDAGYVVLALETQEEGHYQFQPLEVTIGRRQDGYTEILSGLTHQQILTKGAYNIHLE